jgi:hypothetical protein
MSQILHVGVSVRWMLNWTRTETRRHLKSMKKPDGSAWASVEEFRDAMMDELSHGIEYLPLGEACEGWNPKTGCPGHEEAA